MTELCEFPSVINEEKYLAKTDPNSSFHSSLTSLTLFQG